MTRIALIVHEFGSDRLETIRRIRAALSCAVSEIMKAVETGGVLIDKGFFDEDDEVSASHLLNLLEWFEQSRIAYRAIEHSEINVRPEHFADYYQITASRLKNLIETDQQIAWEVDNLPD